MDQLDLGDSSLTLILGGVGLGAVIAVIMYWLGRKGP